MATTSDHISPISIHVYPSLHEEGTIPSVPTRTRQGVSRVFTLNEGSVVQFYGTV